MENHLLKNRNIIFTSFFLFLVNASAAGAEWVLPDNQNLPESFDAGIINLTNWLLGFVAALSIIAIIWGGLRYVGSSGSQDQAQGAKKTIQYAIMGLGVAGLAYAFINTIITQVLR
jgi:hypothetical protein